MNWHPSSEKAEAGRMVWVIERHWKGDLPRSYKISGGEVVHNEADDSWRIEVSDYFGNGFEVLESQEGRWWDAFEAWAYVEDIDLIPDFLLERSSK